MIDLDGELEVFIITNGRSTFEYCQDFINKQRRVKFKTTVHRDMTWLDANTKILDVCKSKFFVRVDDDMILHPHAIAFMWHTVQNQSEKIACRGFRLWEPYSNKIIKGVKTYTLDLCKKIGFKISKIGKIDKVFAVDAKKHRLRVKYGEDVVGIHSCTGFDEHLRYALMRGEDKNPRFAQEKVWMRQHITGCKLSLNKQSRLTGKFLRRLNRANGTNFYKFMRTPDPEQDVKVEG